MKPLIVRIAALGTVVVLGLIAIAQAQRGADRTSVDSPGSDTLAAADGSGGNPFRRGSTPPMRSTSDADNPLRSAPPVSLPFSDDRTRVIPAAATEPIDSLPPASPISMPSPGGANPPPAVVTRDSFPSASAAGLPPASDTGGNVLRNPPTDRYPSFPPAAAADTVPPAAEAMPSFPSRDESYPSAPADSRYAPSASEIPPASSAMAGDDEPGRFRSDPFAPPTSIDRSSVDRQSFDRHSFDRHDAAFAADHTSGPPMAMAADSALGGSMPTGEGSGRPGSKMLEGPQAPKLTIEKFAPKEIQVGKQATFRIAVRNTGDIDANGVKVHDQVPKGTRLVGTTPRASQDARGELVWDVGTIEPGDEAVVEMQLMPVDEGEVGSVATVTFSATASVRTVATKPQLAIATSAPDQVLIGDDVLISITVSNPGSGTATGVVLSEQIPQGLRHAAGSDLEYEVGDLKPGETKKLELTLEAAKAGRVINMLVAKGDGNLRAEDRAQLEVLAPDLNIAVSGPKKRYLECEATYRLSVANPGTASAKDVELVAYLPSGLKFVSANNAGYYEESDNTIRWRLEELPQGEKGTVELVTMPIESGEHTLRLQGKAEKGLVVEEEQPVNIEGIAAILFEMVDVQDPIEVGGETTYEVRVLNQGSKAATNVRLAVMLPPQMQPVAAEGPSRHVLDGNRVLFDGLSRFAPKADTTFRIRARGLNAGDLRISAKLLTDEMKTPVTKEESTRVYADE